MAKYQFRVEVEPAFLAEQSAPEQGVFTFSYTITITNVGEVAAQLISRHWVITDSAGAIQEVKGLGVVGHQPLLQPGQSFQYSSGCRLATPTGTMRGSYFCVADDGERFETAIEPFVLEDGSRRVLH